jgi:hypothetical protein
MSMSSHLSTRSCLCATPLFGPLAIPLYLEKLMAGSPVSKVAEDLGQAKSNNDFVFVERHSAEHVSIVSSVRRIACAGLCS